jgi:tRNA(fMet)-specific endonuclease VapC
LHAGHPQVVRHLRDLDDPNVATTVVTRVEILRGRFEFLLKAADGAQLLRAQQFLSRSEELLAQIVTLPFDEHSTQEFDRLRSQRSIAKVGRADLLIASIALAHRATLVTRNIRHFSRIPGLTVVNWVD